MSFWDKAKDWWQDWGNPLGFAMNAGGMIYNAISGSSDREQQQKQFEAQHALAKDQLYNGVQIRRADLEAAGLHPTLAAGNAGHTPLPSSNAGFRPPLGQVTANTLMDAQIAQSKAQTNLINAEAAKVRKDTEMIDPEFQFKVNKVSRELDIAMRNSDINLQNAMTKVEEYGLSALKYYSHEIHERDQRLRFERELHELEKEARRLNITGKDISNWIDYTHGRIQLKDARLVIEDVDKMNFIQSFARLFMYFWRGK